MAPASNGTKGPNKKLLAIVGGIVLVVVIVVAVVLATGSSSNNPLAVNSPGWVVNGFMKAVLMNNGPVACSYFPASEQSQCNTVATSFFSGAHGSAKVVSSFIDGKRALVSVTGTVCAPFISQSAGASDCSSNSNANAGMPSNDSQFSHDFSLALSEGSNVLSPVPCIYVDGKWILDSSSS